MVLSEEVTFRANIQKIRNEPQRVRKGGDMNKGEADLLLSGPGELQFVARRPRNQRPSRGGEKLDWSCLQGRTGPEPLEMQLGCPMLAGRWQRERRQGWPPARRVPSLEAWWCSFDQSLITSSLSRHHR